MMKIPTFLAVVSVSVLASLGSMSSLASEAYGEPFEGWGFVSDDWQLVCDNTLTCRAAGYSEDGAELRGSILMTLPAGAKIPTAQVILNYWDLSESENAKLQTQLVAADYKVGFWLNDKFYGTVSLDTGDSTAVESNQAELTRAQTLQLIAQAQKDTTIDFRLNDYQWQISDKGMAAILLKLDDAQGRVGTSLALIAKGNKDLNLGAQYYLKPAKAIPKIYAAKPYPFAEYASDNSEQAKTADEQKYYKQLSERYNKQWQNKMSAWATATLDEEQSESCEILTSDQAWFDKENKVWQFIPIDSKHTLVSHPCWMGAYNSGAGYWLIDNNKPNEPELITLSGSEYSDGEIYAAHKGRGIGDCWSAKQWIWNGKKFVMTSDMSTGLCRLISAGGAWELPTYVSEVIKNK